jgi:molybdopterin synthase catalytic subunit
VTDKIRLLEIRDSALDIGPVYDAVGDPEAGGVAVFVGTVRRHDGGKDVSGLGYSAHPSAADALRRVAERVATSESVIALAAAHRTGDLALGDIAVIVAVSCPHRRDAFTACRRLIDDLKAEGPSWKHQLFDEGSDECVGTR